jgi:hypothetical protein
VISPINPGRRCIGVAALSVGLCTVVLAIIFCSRGAFALPSYARQTGQPCASCHTAFPELTPFGRRFKLNGYVLEGGDSKIPPLAAMAIPSFTNTKTAQTSKPGPDPLTSSIAYGYNDNLEFQQASLFYGGKIYGNVGAFIQTTYSGGSNRYSWDNADIRAAGAGSIGPVDFVYGVTANNNPTVQDLWNSTPAWAFPYIASNLAPTPSNATLIQGALAGRVVGSGVYTFWHDILYVEAAAYGQLTKRAQSNLGIDPTQLDALDGAAPYWRIALEPSWGNHSLMIGTFGLDANIRPQDLYGVGTDRITDYGFDTQYQYLGDIHAFTARASYIHEVQQFGASQLQGIRSNYTGHLDSLNLSASYIYDHTVSLTAGFFNLKGNPDGTAYGFSADGITPLTPNSRGLISEVAYLPFSHGGPSVWPWANARLGIQYIYYTKVDGLSSNIDGAGRNAHDNNTLFLYAWTAF